MISRASFGIVFIIGVVLLFAIWPNIFPLQQQHAAMAEIVPGSAPANTTTTGTPANPTGAPANTTGAPANTTGAEAPEARPSR